jgi:hypothetical protein
MSLPNFHLLRRRRPRSPRIPRPIRGAAVLLLVQRYSLLEALVRETLPASGKFSSEISSIWKTLESNWYILNLNAELQTRHGGEKMLR